MTNLRNWIDNNIIAIIVVAACIITAIGLTFAIIACVNSGNKETFDVVEWTINPANPASPLHIGH